MPISRLQRVVLLPSANANGLFSALLTSMDDNSGVSKRYWFAMRYKKVALSRLRRTWLSTFPWLDIFLWVEYFPMVVPSIRMQS